MEGNLKADQAAILLAQTVLERSEGNTLPAEAVNLAKVVLGFPTGYEIKADFGRYAVSFLDNGVIVRSNVLEFFSRTFATPSEAWDALDAYIERLGHPPVINRFVTDAEGKRIPRPKYSGQEVKQS